MHTGTNDERREQTARTRRIGGRSVARVSSCLRAPRALLPSRVARSAQPVETAGSAKGQQQGRFGRMVRDIQKRHTDENRTSS
jgi:hypothetical protein